MRKVTLKTLLLPVISLIILASWFSQASDFQLSWVQTVVASDTFMGKVVGVSDGDTISVMRGGQTVKVRFHGIDCPETRQPYGTRAKQYASEMAFGNEVEVRIKTTDRCGRIVGEVILPDGSCLNKELVPAGLAWWYHKYAPDDRTLKALEAGARSEKKGL